MLKVKFDDGVIEEDVPADSMRRVTKGAASFDWKNALSLANKV